MKSDGLLFWGGVNRSLQTKKKAKWTPLITDIPGERAVTSMLVGWDQVGPNEVGPCGAG